MQFRFSVLSWVLVCDRRFLCILSVDKIFSVVYQIKCIVDAILNEAEDLSDYLINKINLLLQELLPSLVVPSCNGIAVIGFCIL